MTVREVRKKSGFQTAQCVICHLTIVMIGSRPDWLPAGAGYVCGKNACRDAMGVPRFVPPDERR